MPDLLAALLCVGVLLTVVPEYPLGGQWLGAGLLLYCALLRRWPHGWLLVMPAALPVLDLAPWTGRFFLDEFDALLAVTLLMRAWRAPAAAAAAPSFSTPARTWLALFCLSSCIALVIGAWPFPAPGLNSFNHYYSQYNGFRLARGLAWALLLWPLLRETLAADCAGTQRRFALGMGLGVFAAALAVIWERAAFTGLFNFDSGYRVVGLFSGMHIGGAYIEAYFALALPFLAWWTLASRRWASRLAGAAMLAVGSYALLVTYARGGYLGAAIAMLVLVIGPHLNTRRRLPPRRLPRGALLLTLLALLAWMVSHGDAMQRRYASTERDLAARAAHWVDAIRMVDATPERWLAGMGTGRYPATYFVRSNEGIVPTYLSLQAENDNTYVALAAGSPLYLEQIIGLQPNRRYELSLRARSDDAGARLDVPICEKWMLYSRRCVWQSFRVGDTGGDWKPFSSTLPKRTLGVPAGLIAPTVKLSLVSVAEGRRVDIDDISVKDGDGRELLRNGGFSKGMDFWFFASDNHLPWHLDNTWLQIAFEQGLSGLVAFAGLVLCAILALVRRLRTGDPFAPALAAALAAFLVLSLLNSLFDFPRITTMIYLILFLIFCNSKKYIPSGNLP